MQRAIPLPAFAASLVEAGRMIGIGLVSAGVLLALSCVGMFISKRTTIIPFGTASKLVISGAYRFTRNPMYVSMVIIYLGVAGIMGRIWPVVLLPLPVAIVSMIVIPFEEARLREIFGNTYTQYCAKVRRWV